MISSLHVVFALFPEGYRPSPLGTVQMNLSKSQTRSILHRFYLNTTINHRKQGVQSLSISDEQVEESEAGNTEQTDEIPTNPAFKPSRFALELV